MSKYKSNKRKIYVAEFSGLGFGSILVVKCKDEDEVRERAKEKLREMELNTDLVYCNIREVKHSENEIFFFNGEY